MFADVFSPFLHGIRSKTAKLGDVLPAERQMSVFTASPQAPSSPRNTCHFKVYKEEKERKAQRTSAEAA